MFERIAAYFAGAPAPVKEIKAEELPCGACGSPGCKCWMPWVPSEPVLSILNAVKTRRKTILLSSDYKYGRYARTERYGFADTQTGRYVTVRRHITTHAYYRTAPPWSGADALGLTNRELDWLIQEIQARYTSVRKRATALAGARTRRELMQEYVK